MKDYKDKVVVITGGATGIGFSFAKRFGEEGAKLVIAGRREDRLRQAKAELVAAGAAVEYFVCDVAKDGDMEKLADFAWSAYGKADAIINNAGISLTTMTAIDTPEEEIRRIFDINFFGVWRGSAVFAKRFIAQGTPAAIINLGSENSLFHAVPYGAPYVATKHALLALTESLREELPAFIHVGLICPGLVKSELNDPNFMALGMDTDKFTKIAMAQIKNDEFFIVSHGYNMVWIDKRYEAIRAAYTRYAPREDGDDVFDIRTMMMRLRGG
ncbi:MAG: SDR family oxidoreductase [Hyphomonadaceae bacterium]|nr:SDR family oxidoreductase [Hyphomonadaceae bacterium]